MERNDPPFGDLVLVKYDQDRSRQAVLLLGTAIEKGYHRRVVKVSKMGFLAPEDVVNLATSGDQKKSRSRRGTSSAPVAEFDKSGNEKE